MGKRESDLDLAFARKIKESPEFVLWVLGRTKFKKYGSDVRLLDEEQASARTAKFWWKHWWCRVPELDTESETDIFIVFEIAETKQRFALHIENKMANGNFTEKQPESYAFRAKHMMSKPRYLDYTDFETILISPLSFRSRNKMRCDLFGCYISYEDISEFIAEFRE